MSVEQKTSIEESPERSMPPSKKMIVLATSIILVVLVACGVGIYRHQTAVTAKNTAAQAAAAKKNARPYTLTPPAEWQRVQPTPEGTTVAFANTAADSDATGTLKAFIVVHSTELNAAAKKLAFDKVAQSYVTQLAQSYDGFTLISSEATVVGDSPAVLTKYSFIQGKTVLTASSLFVVKQGVSYAVNGESLTSAWPSHSVAIEQALLSFRP